MSARLDELITSARGLDVDWDGECRLRVREGIVRRRDGRVRRALVVRRGLGVAGAAGLLVFALLRAASSASARPVSADRAEPTSASEVVASCVLADAGYARD